jgi:hypothetical protein
MLLKPTSLAALLTASLPVAAQELNLLDCQGAFAFLGAKAVLSGVRQFVPISAVGDAHVQFQGRIAAAGIEGTMAYEGYTRTAPSLGPPRTVGEFVCDWR